MIADFGEPLASAYLDGASMVRVAEVEPALLAEPDFETQAGATTAV